MKLSTPDCCLFNYSVNQVLPFEIMSHQSRNSKFPALKSLLVGWWWWGGLFDYSVKPGPDLSRLRPSLVLLVTRSIKARFGQVVDQVSQVKDQFGQGQGQELDNYLNQNKIKLSLILKYSM